MSEEAGEDMSWLIETYLREAGMPELLSSESDHGLTLTWSVPGDRYFPMPVEVSVDGQLYVVDMKRGSGTLMFAPPSRVVIDPRSKILRALPIIGDCSEQTEEQIEANIERFTRMAREYGWQRD